MRRGAGAARGSGAARGTGALRGAGGGRGTGALRAAGASRGTGAARAIGVTAVIAAIAALAFAPAAASAHPLGNFSINHLSQVSISTDVLRVHYILDQAEIPTFQERGLGSARVLDRKRAEIVRGLRLRVDGRRIPLTPQAGARISFPPGQGGLRLTRVELDLSAPIAN